MKNEDGLGQGTGPDDSGRPNDAWVAEAVETLLFGGRPLYPSFNLRTVAFLGKDERRAAPPPEGEYVVGPEEREDIVAAFRDTFGRRGGPCPPKAATATTSPVRRPSRPRTRRRLGTGPRAVCMGY